MRRYAALRVSRRQFLWVGLGFSALTALHAQDAVGRVVVRISGVRNGKGTVHVGLWKSKEGFPKDVSKALRNDVAAIVNGSATSTFRDVPFGEYAVAVFHDENSNGKLDSRFLGIPSEGIGTSNNPHPKFGPPSYDDCRFEVSQPEKVLEIKMIYL